jgi:hypothetical protein
MRGAMSSSSESEEAGGDGKRAWFWNKGSRVGRLMESCSQGVRTVGELTSGSFKGTQSRGSEPCLTGRCKRGDLCGGRPNQLGHQWAIYCCGLANGPPHLKAREPHDALIPTRIDYTDLECKLPLAQALDL